MTKLLLWFLAGAYLAGYATWSTASTEAPVTEWKNPQSNAWETSIGAAKAGWESLYPYVAGSVTYYIDSSAVDGNGKITYYYHSCSPGCSGTQGPQYYQLLSRQTCSANHHLEGSQCVDDVDCSTKRGQKISEGYYDIGTSAAASPAWLASSCTGGCQARFNGVVPAGQDNQTPRHYYAKGNFEYDGWTCNGSAAETPTAAAAPSTQCPTGQCPATFNGQPMCLPCGSDTPQKTVSTKTTTNPDNTTTTTTTTTTQTGDKVETETTTVGGVPGSGQTQPSGDTGKTEQDKSSFCEENPDSPLCKNSSFGGSCGSFSCDGDAIQCAMAREQHQRNCVLFDTATPLSTLGEQVASGSDPLASSYPTATGQQQTVNLSTAIDTSNPFASGCLQDKSFTIMTTTLVIPFSNICPYLEMMGQIVLTFSLLMAARIMYSGV